jgi:predicted GNAT family acetyltransferase
MAVGESRDVTQCGDVLVRDNSDAHRYEATIDGEVVGRIDYHSRPPLITLLHTEVDPAFEGRGVGSRLVAAALDDIRGRQLSVLPICPFARSYIASHAEYADLVGVR